MTPAPHMILPGIYMASNLQQYAMDDMGNMINYDRDYLFGMAMWHLHGSDSFLDWAIDDDEAAEEQAYYDELERGYAMDRI